MNLNAADIEQIVRTVMSQLTTGAATRPTISAATASSATGAGTATATETAVAAARPVARQAGAAHRGTGMTASASSISSSDSSISITAGVITQSVLEESLTGRSSVRTIRIPAKAVVTPTARDVLKKRALEIVRESAGTAANSSGTAAKWQVFVSRAAPQALSALKNLRNTGGAWRQQTCGTAIEAARQAVSVLCRAESAGVVVITDEPERVVCLANRNPKVRAATALHLQHWSTLQRSLSPNLLAVAPQAKSVYELQSLLRAVLEGPVPVAPADWGE